MQTAPVDDDLLEHLPGGAGVSHLPGAGAAGGIGGGLVALLGASLSPGIDLLLDAVKFDTLLDGCNQVLTGEGRFDAQSLQGKAILGVCRRAAAKHVPVIALVGAVAGGESAAYEQGLTALFPICTAPVSLETAMAQTKENLRFTVRSVLRTLAAYTYK